MDLAERFRTAVSFAYDNPVARAELVPMVLSQACVAVLPVAGAGLSITDRLRVPLGASDEHAACVERLQTTLGEGPCIDATRTMRPIAADSSSIAVRWPTFHRQFVSRTPYRSVASFPLLSRDRELRLGALDLYLTIPEAVPQFFLDQVSRHIADPIATVLFDSHLGGDSWVPPWLDNASVRDRMHVWVGIGILIEHADLTNQDALTALRSYAYAHDSTLDAVADQLMRRQLEPAALLG